MAKIFKIFKFGKLKYLLLVLFAALVSDIFVYEPYFALHTSDSVIYSKKWPKELENLKIAVISDFHAGALFYDKWRMRKVVELVNKEKPDMVLLLGDYFNRYFYNTSMDYEKFAEYLLEIEAPLGKFAVTGNHDTYMGTEKIEEQLSRAGVKFLRNKSAKVETKNGDFYVAGIPDFGTDIFNLQKAFEDVPEGGPCIFLTHDPSVFPALPRKAAVTFAGHSHGGQFRIPFYGPFLKGVINLYTEFSSDGLLVNHRDDPIFITRGIGTSSIPARFFCTPQIEIISIKPY